MFGLFKTPEYFDPQLGRLVRSRGYWRGAVDLGPFGKVPLALAGPRLSPDPAALAAAREVTVQFPALQAPTERALFEHYHPYAEALAAGELPPPIEPMPALTSPAMVWPHVSLAFLSIGPISGQLTVELGYATAWDEEHTLGARFRQGALVELCGSAVPL
ncbi:DUF6985 domain-containing protein [Chitinimonas koreensis]|uniref:DUF6985 domain-containing protein n=1 Tax=Chitinimonas koreensis TaxID=356302 RepID=UPI000416E4D3|nr:hypothetical protein [Chitinimonas koreensis]QNM97977.1 hypothetical protein H9L41_06885 [Chitinimonas koreensis]